MPLNLPDTLITSDQEKLPAPARELLAEDRALPPEVVFYEQCFTWAATTKQIGIAVVLLVIAAFLFIFSLEFLYYQHVDPKYREYVNFKVLVASLVFAFAGWLMLGMARSGRAQARRQAAGVRTRFGVFLLPDALVSHTNGHTTIIPRGSFRGLSGNTINYLLNNVPKSFALPNEWIGAPAADVQRAITAWGQSVPPQAS